MPEQVGNQKLRPLNDQLLVVASHVFAQNIRERLFVQEGANEVLINDHNFYVYLIKVTYVLYKLLNFLLDDLLLGLIESDQLFHLGFILDLAIPYLDVYLDLKYFFILFNNFWEVLHFTTLD